MSSDIRNAGNTGSRIALEDIVEAASQGVLRALEARDRVPEKGEGFYVDFRIRCGIPAVVLQGIGGPVGELAEEAE